MKSILITGVAGLIGSRLARFLLDYTDDYVVGIDDFSTGLYSNVPPGLRCHDVQLGDQQSYAVFDRERPDMVYHFAAYAAECLSPFVRCHNYRNNLVAAAEVVNACIRYGVKRLVFTSSAAVYGHGQSPFDETDATIPADPYGVAKLACEQDIRIAGVQHGLDWCVLRPHNVYGPGQSPYQRFRNVFGIWMDAAIRGEPLRVFGDGLQRRAFTYVDDIVRPLYMAGFCRAASRQVINLGSPRSMAVIDAARVLMGVMGQGTVEHVGARHEVRDCWCTSERAEAILGYQDVVPLDVGLAAMWRWVRELEPEEPRLPVIEVADGLPEAWLDAPCGSPVHRQTP